MGGATKKGPTPPPAVNEPLAFINFVAAFPIGSTVEGEVVSFTSHGAMVDVSLPGGGVLHCYIPLTAMGTPPPTRARQVLKKGEGRPFVLAGLDPPRRVAELALPALPARANKRGATGAEPAGRRRRSRRACRRRKKAAAKKAAAKKPAAKKAAAKKAATKKAASVKKATRKTTAPAKKAAATKATRAKKAAAKKGGKARAR